MNCVMIPAKGCCLCTVIVSFSHVCSGIILIHAFPKTN